MLSKYVSRGVGLAVFGAMMLVSYAAYAQNFTFYMTKQYSGTISVTFYSETRNHEWPGGDQVFVMHNNQRYSFPLSCQNGEKICYGAWIRGNPDKYWGVGQHKRFGCSNCCYVCDGGYTRTINLLYP